MAATRTRVRGLSCGSREIVAATQNSSATMMSAQTPQRQAFRMARMSLDRRSRPTRSVTTSAMKVAAVIKVVCEAGKANPSPPVGPALGAKGVNIMAFCKEYNAKTAQQSGEIIPAVITVFEDKSFTFVLKTPPTGILIKKAVGISKGASTRGPKGEKVGTINEDQLKEIASKKMPDLNTDNIEIAMRIVAGQAQNMGVIVDWDAFKKPAEPVAP